VPRGYKEDNWSKNRQRYLYQKDERALPGHLQNPLPKCSVSQYLFNIFLISCVSPIIGIWKGAATQAGLEPGSRGIAIVRSRHEATTTDDTAGWKRHNVCCSDL
jgi:hypothetical protein